MEQRIGSSSQPLEGAGFDPAFIPGLTSPVTAEPEDAKPAEDEEGEPATKETPAAETSTEQPDPADDAAGDSADDAAEDSDGDADGDSAEELSSEGPVFEASDRRARIAADAKGVRLRLDEEECEFRWDEIGAIETESPRFGKRFTITVHTPDRRWYPIEIEATARARFGEWEKQLDDVLDAYFEEGDAEDDDVKDAAVKDAD